MDHSSYIAGLAASPEETLLLRRLLDRLDRFRSRSTPETTRFLSPREQALCRQLLQAEGESAWTLWGGYPGAERQILCFLPDWLPEHWQSQADAPLAAVRCRFPGSSLEHRDLLGALMSAGLKRETLGDILVEPGQADFVVLREVLPYLLSQLTRAGRASLHPEELPLSQLTPPPRRLEQRRETVASLRADCVLAAALNLSRDKAAGLVRQGLVRVDSLDLAKPDRPLQAGQTLSVRGHGKFILQEITGPTRKGRIAILLAKYL